MPTNLHAAMPLPAVPMVDPASGVLAPVWFRWFLTLWNRTGGATGGEAPPLVVALGTSPFLFTAPQHGTLLISGGGMIRREISNDGVIWYATGSYYGALPINKGAQARLTYIGTPIATFIYG